MTKVADRFKLLSKFTDDVFLAQDEDPSGDQGPQRIVVVKRREVFDNYEEDVYKALGNATGFPRLRWSGWWDDGSWIALDYMGCGLELLCYFLPTFVNAQTVASLAVQMTERIRHLHSLGYVHGDIKPNNFTLGAKAPGIDGEPGIPQVNLIDFDASWKCVEEEKDSDDRFIFPKFANRAFSSINFDAAPAKRDDLESLAYSLVYLVRQEFPPWMADGPLGYKDKSETVPEELCKGLPPVYARFMRYARELEENIEPDYDRFVKEFREASLTCNADD